MLANAIANQHRPWADVEPSIRRAFELSDGLPPVFSDDEIVSPGTTAALMAAARGQIEEAAPKLQAVVRSSSPGAPHTLPAFDALSDALIRRGDVDGALAVLSPVANRQTTYPFTGSRGLIWLRLRAKLLALERQLGHRDRAVEIELELRELLVAADPDFALRRDLN
jgi:hypothetical protein